MGAIKRVAILDCQDPSKPKILRFGKFRNLDPAGLSKKLTGASNRSKKVILDARIYRFSRGEPMPDSFDVLIIPGSDFTPTRKSVEGMDWMKRAIALVNSAIEAQKPVFGICFGHQLIAAALGVYSIPLPMREELGSHEVQLTDNGLKDELFRGVPQRFFGVFFHWFGVPELPPGTVQLATSESRIQGFRIANTWAVQFHPDYGQVNAKILKRAYSPIITAPVDTEHDAKDNCKVFANFLDIARCII